MRRSTILTLLVAGALALSASVAVAASPHFKPPGSGVTCTTSGSGASATTTCGASLAGLGNQDVKLVLSTSGSAVYQCQNNGGQTAPGQNRVLVGPSVTPVTIPGSDIKNGNLSFSITNMLSSPTTVTGAEAGCPNPNWTGVNPVLTVTSVSLSIQQPPGTEIFSCSASNPNGLSGTYTLSC